MKKTYTLKKENTKANIFLELENGCFSCSGEIYEYGKCTCGGQCIDEIADLFIENETAQEIRELWKKYHLNDMHAGTPEQEGALERAGLGEFANKYSECCEYLKRIGLYDQNGYKFGTGWLKWEIPAKDLKRIENLLK